MTGENAITTVYWFDASAMPDLTSCTSVGHLDVEDINGSGQRFRIEFMIKDVRKQ